MKKQTAVEWLFAHLLPFLPFSDPKEREHFRKCLAEAKAMEKEQMWEYIKTHYVNGTNSLAFHKDEFEQYYNETYGGDQ